MRDSTAPHVIEPIGTPAENLAAFVAVALASTNFGAALVFYAPRWDVTCQTRDRPGVLSGRRSIGFDPWKPRGRKGAERASTAVPRAVIDAPSVESLNRAFVRLMRNPSHSQLKIACVAGSLLVEAMMRLGLSDVADITFPVFNEAAKIASGRYTKDYRSNVAYALEQRARFLDAQGLTYNPVKGWRFPKLRARRRSKGRSASGSKRLLPSKEQLMLVLRAYHAARDECDLVITRTLVLLLAAPERINEVLAIGVNPEVEMRSASGQQALQLRWVGSKRYPDGLKAIPNVMAKAVRKSLSVLRKHTEEGRRILNWYRSNPTSLYLPPELEHLRACERMEAKDVARLFAVRTIKAADALITKYGIEQLPALETRSGAASNVSFKAIERYFLLSILPGKLRDVGASEAEPLLVVKWKTFRRKAEEPCPCMFEKVTYRRISSALMQGGTNVTIFRRLCGAVIGVQSITTKSFRHLLTTLAERNGMRETDLAMWSGRHNTRHNRQYDQRTPAEMREQAKQANPRSRRTTSPLARGAGTRGR